MKQTLLFLFFLAAGSAGAQIVNIPDNNFKYTLLAANASNYTARDNNGNFIQIDTNNDLEIQVSEALAVYDLFVQGSGISDLTGIEFFTNLEILECGNNSVNSLDVSALVNLIDLDCKNNNLVALDLSTCFNLTTLNCGGNDLSVLNISGLNSLETILCHDNNLTTVDLNGLSNVTHFYIANNQLASIDISDMLNLQLINCENNNITSLNCEGLINMNTLICSSNAITSLDLTSNTALTHIQCNNNQLNLLNITGLGQATMIECGNNNLTALNLTGLQSLNYLGCADNNLVTLNFSETPALGGLDCHDNNLVTLDFSNNPMFFNLSCYNNNLEYINIKNGYEHLFNEDALNDWSGNPNLQFVCVDESEFEIVEAIMQQNGMTVNFNSYCSFTPGGAYNTITGTTMFDANSDGCGPGDVPQTFIKIGINDGTNTGATFANSAGDYNFYTGAGNFTVVPIFENNNYFTAVPASSAVNFPVVNNLIAIEDFCIQPNGAHNDIEVVMVPVVPASPGFDAVYKIVYRNKGNQVLSGGINCIWDATKFAGVELLPVPDVQAQGNYTWNYSNLLPFENREIIMTLEVNAPTDEVPVNNGDILDFTATATLGGTDDMPSDNVFVLNQEVVGSFDPNNIICIEGETQSTDAIGDYLHYVVNFENTGTAPATFIVVTHEIDPADFDINTLQVLNSSHAVQATVTGNTVEFVFNSINLDAMDHGNILFKLKSNSGLVTGDNVVNSANIFFDYNFPIETNDAETIFASLSLGSFEQDATVKVYPNPANDIITIAADNNLQSIELFDIQGRVLETRLLNEYSVTLDLSARAAGVYLVRIKTEAGVKVEKVIKY